MSNFNYITMKKSILFYAQNVAMTLSVLFIISAVARMLYHVWSELIYSTNAIGFIYIGFVTLFIGFMLAVITSILIGMWKGEVR